MWETYVSDMHLSIYVQYMSRTSHICWTYVYLMYECLMCNVYYAQVGAVHTYTAYMGRMCLVYVARM